MKEPTLQNAQDFSEKEDIRDYNHPVASVTVDSLDYLIGSLFTHTELLGLSDRQAAAYKSTVRRMFWDWYNNHLPNPNGLADPSFQGRMAAGIEKAVMTATGHGVYGN